MYAYVENGNIVEIFQNLPTKWKSTDNLHLANDVFLKSLGFYNINVISPPFNHNFQVKGSIRHEIAGDIVNEIHTVEDRSLTDMKAHAKSHFSAKRSEKEKSGTTVTLPSTKKGKTKDTSDMPEYRVKTDADSRLRLANAALMANIGGSAFKINWKFDTEWATLDKNQMLMLAQNVHNFTQSVFDEEMLHHTNIDNLTTSKDVWDYISSN